MSDSLQPRRSVQADRIAAIKQQVASRLHLSEEETVLVTELTCADDCCPYLETVIAVLQKGRPTFQATASVGLADYCGRH